MLIPSSALLDPSRQNLDFCRRNRITLRRHPLEFVFAGDPRDQHAGFDIAGDDRELPRVGFGKRRFFVCKPQTALSLVGTMTRVTAFGQNRLNLLDEVNLRLGGCRYRFSGWRRSTDPQNENDTAGP